MISNEQVTALAAQAARAARYEYLDDAGNLLPDWYFNDLGQPVYLGPEVATRGVGIYGHTPENLVLVGLLKPASLQLITAPSMTLTVLLTPSAWTGLFDINSLLGYLNSPAIQNLAQISLYNGAFQGLLQANLITGAETARYQATFLQPAVRYGVDAVVAWTQDLAASDLASAIQISARQAQYAIDFVDRFGPELNVAPELGAFDNTVFRNILDETVTQIIGNEKIPAIEFADTPPPAIATSLLPLGDRSRVAIPKTTDEDGTLRFSPGTRG
jgi:hypothetical protein